MRALSMKPVWSSVVLLGGKTIGCRTWQTDYRGDLLICSSARKEPGGIPGRAVCVVELESIEPFTESHLYDAFMDEMPEKQSFAWRLANLRYIEPFPVKGRLHLFDVPDDSVHIIEGGEDVDILENVYKPLVYFGSDSWARDLWDFSDFR